VIIEESAYYGGQLLSSSLFDRQNPHNLVNLIPRHIIDDNGDNNQGFLVFKYDRTPF
jgi:hypothetical protein